MLTTNLPGPSGIHNIAKRPLAGRRILLGAACSILALATCTSALALHAAVASDSSAATGTPKILSVKPEIMAGDRISGENPIYPAEARKKKIQGKVVLDALISREGEIQNLHVVQSPDKLLSDSSLKAVRTWRYRPYLLNGNPVEVKTTINVTYSLGS